MHRRLVLAIALPIAFSPRSVSAQDVEMLGRRYGKQPPAAYYEELARNPDAFRFSTGRTVRMREAAEQRRILRGDPRLGGAIGGAGDGAAGVVGAAGAGSGPAAVGLGPRDEPVVGDIYVPVVLGLFSDSPATPPVLQSEIQNGYFGPQAGSVAQYYAEVSSDSIALNGDVRPWVTSPMTQASATEGISGLGCCGIGNYIKSLLDLQGPGVNWGAYDNDGPDGVPNSGDDDGYVDALAVIHPTAGAECPGTWPDRIWSHKWTLSDASTGGAYPTTTPRTGYPGQVILIEDYFVQGAVACGGSGLNEIGVFTHEMGHAFGLPDLYDTRPLGVAHDGAGSWELMATGTWGCSGTTPDLPCHMGAWSKAMLGWVTVDTLAADTDFGTLVLPPVETNGIAYRVDAADGSGEYFLLENRQSLPSVTYDQALPREGLLVWQVDQAAVDARWLVNTVNAFDHMGVWLRQADGLDELGVPGGDRGDAGDPFPGSTINTAFHAATNPAARSFQGTATGLSVLDIAHAGDDMAFHLLTRFTSMPDLVVSLVATVADTVQLMVQDGTPPISWSVVGGTLPLGIAVDGNGRVLGASLDLGLFPVSVEATDALGLTASATLTFDVASPSLPMEGLTAPFLLGAQPLDSLEEAFLDRQGNDDGEYDLGDFRAWVLANPTLPLSAAIKPPRVPASAERRVIFLPMWLEEPEEGR